MRLIIIILFFSPDNAFALDKKYENLAKQKAQQVIDSCWAISLEDRSSINTNRHRAGALDTALCMEEHIIMLAETKLFASDPEAIERTKQNMEKLRFSYGRFYWDLFNEIDICFEGPVGTGCGTAFFSSHNFHYAYLLENILHDIYEQIARYEIPFDD